jgi:anionic cell wall polymer biosynthesis LytR-Cps2A-Psr (LCP) family protein
MKIFNDILKGPDGKYSRKSLTMFVSFISSVVLGTYIVVANYITDIPINQYAIDVFQGFLLLVGTLSGVTVWDKQNLFKNKETKE